MSSTTTTTHRHARQVQQQPQQQQQQQQQQLKLKKYSDLHMQRKSPFMMHHSLGSIRTNFHSAMPAPPLDSKLLLLPHTVDLQPFVDFRSTSLDRSVRHELLSELNMGVDLELVDPRTYVLGDYTSLDDKKRGELTFGSIDQEGVAGAAAAAAVGDDNNAMDPVDRMLLRDLKEDMLERERDERRKRLNKEEIWLRKPEYLTRADEELYGQPASSRRASRMSMRDDTDTDDSSDDDMFEEEQEQEQEAVMSVDQVHALIERQFQRAKQLDTKQFRHPDPKKRHLKPVSVMSVMPDTHLWTNSYALVTFDNMPIPYHLQPDHPVSRKPFSQCTFAEQQQIKEGMQFNQLYNTALLAESDTASLQSDQQQHHHQHVARREQHVVDYLLPRSAATANDTEMAGSAALEKAADSSRTTVERTLDYGNVREYLMRVVSDDDHFDDTYMFHIDEDKGTVSYNRIRTKIALSAKKEYSDTSAVDRAYWEKRKQEQRMLVTARNFFTGEEMEQSKKRMRDLEPVEVVITEATTPATATTPETPTTMGDDVPNTKRTRLE